MSMEMTPVVDQRRLRRLARAEWDRALAGAIIVGGGALLVVSQQQLSASPSRAEQVAYLTSGGFGGLLAILAGVVLLLVLSMRDTSHKLNRVEAAIRGEPLPAPGATLARLVSAPHQAKANDHPIARPNPWPAIASGMLIAAGCALTIGGWLSAARTQDLAKALNGLPLAGAGVGLAAAGLVGYALWARLTLQRRMRACLGSVRITSSPSPRTKQHIATVTNGSAVAWTASGLTYFHLAECPALHGAAGDTSSVAVASTTLRPCPLCRAEELSAHA